MKSILFENETQSGSTIDHSPAHLSNIIKCFVVYTDTCFHMTSLQDIKRKSLCESNVLGSGKGVQ